MLNFNPIGFRITHWMRFDGETERSFLRDYAAKFATQRRIAIIGALIVNLIYFGIDTFDAISDKQFNVIYINMLIPLRSVNVIIMSISILLALRPASKTNELYVCCCVYATALSNCLMILMMSRSVISTEYHYLFNYYDNMFILLFFLFGLARMLIKPTLMLALLLLLISTLTLDSNDLTKLSQPQAINFRDPDPPFYVLIIFSIIGCYISFDQERTARHTFLRERELRRAREETEIKTAELLALKEQSRLQAERQNQDKSRFIAAAAHDLRNAMQPVGSYLDVGLSALARGDRQNAREHLEEAKTANHNLRSAVNALLEISELESGIIEIHYSHFDARRLAAEVFKHHELLAAQNKVRLRLSKNRGMPAIVHSERHHLQRVLVNLVTNGIKYADCSKGESATVAIAIVCRGDTVRVAVVDNGIGIPRDQQQEVLKPLRQLHNPERNREKGVGLGLSNVHSTINLLADHHFKLSSKPGLGTRFTLALPKGDPLEADEPQLLPAENCALDGFYMLLVENDLAVKKSMTALLQENGAAHEAFSSVEALQEWLAALPTVWRDFDAVVTDYRLPDERTAVDVFAALKTHYGYDIPGLVITGETADLNEASELRNRKILRKPVDAKQLLAEINRLCLESDEASA